MSQRREVQQSKSPDISEKEQKPKEPFIGIRN